MSTAALHRAVPLVRATRAEVSADPFGPDVPLTWWLVRLRYADERPAPRMTRLKEFARRVWYDKGKQPRTSGEERPVFPDFRRNYGSRAEARRWCRDSMDCLFAFPYGGEPFGEEIFNNPTFCRPHLNEEQRRKDARDAERYTAKLEEFICSALAQENRNLRAQLSGIRDALDE